jgi:ketosteroid isomerase-like protein
MSRTAKDFDAFIKERKEASDAFVNGDVAPLKRISAQASPATIFGPKGDTVQGAAEVIAANAKGAERFKPGSENAFEVMHQAVSDDFAYWVGVQRSVVKMEGKEQGVPMDLRVTELFRRENGDWKLFHRHADELKSNDAG